MITRIMALACACMMATHTMAADRGFYFGVTGGRAEYDFESLPPPFMVNPPAIAPFPRAGFGPWPPGEPAFGVIATPIAVVSGFSFNLPGADDHDTAWSVLAGYRISKYVAAELAYVDLGKLVVEYDVPLWPSGVVSARETLATRGPTLTALGILPITAAWEVYVRAGAYFLDSELTTFLGDGRDALTFGSEGLIWGAGTQLAIGKHWAARLDFQRHAHVGRRFSPGRADIDVFSVGVLYRL